MDVRFELGLGLSLTLLAACGADEFGDAMDAGASKDASTPSDAPSDDARASDGMADVEKPFDSGTAALMPTLGTASTFAVLGGATVTNTGTSTVVEGDLGTKGPAVTGLSGNPTQPTGKTEINNPTATTAFFDVGVAYAMLGSKGCPPANDLSGLDLGGMTLAPGVYCFSAEASQLASTTLTFDAKGDPDAVWIIQVGTALTVMDGARAVVVGGPASLACRIFWTMGTAATLNENVQWVGTLLASSATGLLTNAKLLPGRIFAETGGVTLLSNKVSAAACQ